MNRRLLPSPDEDRDHEPLYAGPVVDKQRGLYMYTVRFTAAATQDISLV